MLARLSFTLLVIPSTAFAFNITLDFTYDDYFTNPDNPNSAAGVAALEAAADQLSAMIGTTLNPIDNNFSTGTSGQTSAAITTNYTFADPRDSSNRIETSPVGIEADEIMVFVGAQSLGGVTFAQASPGSPSLSIQKFGPEDDWVSAVALAESASNETFGRGAGYDIQRLSFNTTYGSTTANANPTYGTVLGSMWFNDSPSNESSGRESWETNSDFWHYDHTTPVASGKLDIYSVAMHELLHVLGYGSGEDWFDHVFGEDWSGENVIELLGSGESVLDADGDHILDGFSSPGLLSGELGSPVMSPTILPGDRLELTELDAAFLRDMGLQIDPVPEPSSAALLSLGLFALVRRRR